MKKTKKVFKNHERIAEITSKHPGGVTKTGYFLVEEHENVDKCGKHWVEKTAHSWEWQWQDPPIGETVYGKDDTYEFAGRSEDFYE